MRKISRWIWAEIVLLIALFIAFVAGAFDARTYAMLGIFVLVVFAVPAFMNLANSQVAKDNNG